jgi:hypothetical protein
MGKLTVQLAWNLGNMEIFSIFQSQKWKKKSSFREGYQLFYPIFSYFLFLKVN